MRTCRSRTTLSLLALLTVACSVPASAQEMDAAFRADVQKLLDLTGASRVAAQMSSMVSTQVLQMLRTTQPGLPDRALDIVKEVLDAELASGMSAPDGVIAQISPVYAKYFTHDEIRALIAFYSTELGRKVTATMPSLMQDSADAGRRWAETNMPRVMGILQSRLQAEGYPVGGPPGSAAGPWPPSGVLRPGAGVVSPRVLKEVKPTYTADALRAKIEGVVGMEAVIETDGSVRDVRVTASLDQVYGLDQQAIAAVKAWQFEPGTKDGTPVRVAVHIDMTFTLKK